MPLSSVIGHQHAVELLSRAAARGSLPPSLILAGPEGVGKHRVAVGLAQVLNCLTPFDSREPALAQGRPFDSREPALAQGRPFDSRDTALAQGRPFDSREPALAQGRPAAAGYGRSQLMIDACGTCSACRRIERGVHPDVLLVGPEGETGSIKVEQAREVSQRAAYRPYEGRRRVVIIDPADAMELSSQNALLKLLEEPPPATVMVLITAQPDVLLPTVRSRCPQIRFGGLTEAEIAEVLTRYCKLPVDEARAAAVLASGSAGRALEMAQDGTTGARSQALDVLRDAASVRDARSLVERMKGTLGVEKKQSSAAAERQSLALSLRALSSLLRDLALIESRSPRVRKSESPKVGEPESPLANADLKDELERLAPAFGRARVVRAYESVDRALRALDSNVGAKLVVDWLGHRI